MKSSATTRVRSVDFLTPEQLQRKREGDRRSQRLIRARTKAYIDELLAKVEELERQKHALENERLTRQAQCVCRDDEATTTATTRVHDQPQQSGSESASSTMVVSNMHSTKYSFPCSNSTWEQIAPSAVVSSTRTSLDSMSWASIMDYAVLAASSPPPEASFSEYSPVSPTSDFRLMPSPTCNQVWAALPNILPPTCPLDKVLVELVRSRRLHEDRCGNIQGFQKQRFPSVHSLLNPEHEPEKGPATSTVVKNIIHIMKMTTVPEQIAVLYMMSCVVRWQISPTEANYDSLPEWLRPTAAQLINAHPAWTDLLPWPRARERICRNPQYQGENANFTKICNANISINWPFTVSDMLVKISDTDSILNPIFEQHIKDIRNWTLGKAFIDAYPDFAGDVNIEPPRRE
ncbi:hypothetical protein K432DRAFT_429272 [Lepidopterella palustris CBS 459.81]|uniref:BZIP domain-containing protein n=1 Tax=Lepidopterella palustris CBS 459.81 TaxID=1314670 RepID=A0A8E2E1I3_9PEZI|nr:hypothetical protein K432DRAFT_429272 [Lepidopterella palustris CBS 459.81]